MTYNDNTMTKVVAIQKLIDGSVTIEDVLEKIDVLKEPSIDTEHYPPGLIHGLKGRKSNNRNNKRAVLQKYASLEIKG